MSEHRQVTPHTVEFDVQVEGGDQVGSMVTWALPNAGDYVRVDDPDKETIYEVVRCYFEPYNLTVIVRPVGRRTTVEQTQSPFPKESPFARQHPGAGGFA